MDDDDEDDEDDAGFPTTASTNIPEYDENDEPAHCVYDFSYIVVDDDESESEDLEEPRNKHQHHFHHRYYGGHRSRGSPGQ